MTVRERPWMKFYPSDWRADPMLRVCSIGARGLWIEMLALMHESDRYGYLLINGKQPTARQIAALAGVAVDELEPLLDELEEQGVFSRDHAGTIYSRRMKRDEKKADHARKIGKKGGNPKLSKQKGNSEQDNPKVKPEDNGGDKPQRPEARNQSPEEGTKPPSSGVKPREPELRPDLRAVMEAAQLASPPDARVLKAWYDAGAELESDILPILRRLSEKERQRTGKPPFSLKFYDSAIREKVAEDEREIERLRRISRRFEAAEAEEAERHAAAGGRG